MLTLLGKPQKFCDGLTRRNFLKIGARQRRNPCAEPSVPAA